MDSSFSAVSASAKRSPALPALQNGGPDGHRGFIVSALSSISLSGMKAAQTALGASAHNIANLSTADFRRDLVTQESVAVGGVTASLRQASLDGHTLEADIVGQLTAKHQFLANLAVFKTHDQLLGALLDTVG